MANKNFQYKIFFYRADQFDLPPTERTPASTVVDATSVARALTKAKKELGVASAREWLPISVAPILSDTERRRYSL